MVHNFIMCITAGLEKNGVFQLNMTIEKPLCIGVALLFKPATVHKYTKINHSLTLKD